ncbi:MAG: hypothetical protein TREMPRED_001694 [Tremellales sp. Tagirdzhanova-0007]|nr:MAG: hypothetical protein TREMPRED_001694 [Tremellales sp. Tagirdzhanova-0007]
MPRDYFSPIKDSLAALRPQLAILPVTYLTSHELRDQLKQTLEEIKGAAEEYIGKKKGKKRGDGQASEAREEEARKADWMDSEAQPTGLIGVSIWNLAAQASRSVATMSGGEEDTEVAAAMRLAAFRLVEAATDPRSSPPYVVRLLGMLSKTVSALLSAGDKRVTFSLIGQGAEYDTALGSTPFPINQKAAKEQSSAMLAFGLTRIDAAMADENSDLALSIVTNALDLESEGYFSVTDVGASRKITCLEPMYQHSTVIWRQNADGRDFAAEAIIWLGKGESLLEKFEAKFEGAASSKEIKIALLRSLARAHLSRTEMDPQAFNAAQAVIQSLMEQTDPWDESNIHDLNILRLHMLKQQKAPEGHLRSVVEQLLKTPNWDGDEFMELLSEIHSLNDYVDLAHSAIQSLLDLALSTPAGHVHVEQIVITTLVSLRSVTISRPQIAHQVATKILSSVSEAQYYGFKDKAKVIAIQTIIWSTAKKVCDQGNHHDVAAQWFKLAGHPSLSDLGNENASRCLRKAALCYVSCGDYGSAQDLIEQCPSSEASTQYLRFLSAVHQGEENAALDAVETIVDCVDLDGKQLLLMSYVPLLTERQEGWYDSLSSLAYDKGLHKVLIKTLSALLSSLERPNIAFAVKIENITLIRCLVRMTLIEMDKTADKNMLASMLLQYFKLASRIVHEDRRMTQTHAKAIAWLYKTAFNAGVQGANSWDQDITSDLFDAAAMLMTAYETIVEADMDPELKLHKGTAKFACLCGKLFACREMTTGPEKQSDLLNLLGGYLQECRGDLMAINLSEPKAAAVLQMMQTLDVFEVEIMCELKNWESVLQVIDDVLKGRQLQMFLENKEIQSLETIADLLSSFPDCPTAKFSRFYFLHASLHDAHHRGQAILNSYSNNSAAGITRFARWIRTILLVVFHRGGGDDDEKAEHFVVRARDVLRTPAGKTSYPPDEAQWLLAQTWNRGLDFLKSLMLHIAKVIAHLAQHFEG